MAQVTVVGAGISGLACARALAAAGDHEITVLDRGYRPGGRMAVHHYDGRPVDIGASYFTVSDPAFEAVVDGWARRGLARAWTDTFEAWTPEGRQPKPGPTRWASPEGLQSLVADLAAGVDVHTSTTVESIDVADGRPSVDGRASDMVVLAMPDPQARRLLAPGLGDMAEQLDAEFDPVLALTSIWPERCWPGFDGLFVNHHDVLAWIADDGRRRGDDAPVLVAHSTPAFARHMLSTPEQAVAPMLSALREIAGIDPSVAESRAEVQAWRLAKPASGRDEPFFLDQRGIGICGDDWSPKPSVEAAFMSGTLLGEALAGRL